MRLHGLHAREVQGGPVIAGDPDDVVALHLPEAKWLGHGQRAVDPVRCRGDQLELDSFLRQLSHGDHGLQRGDSTSDDRDPCRSSIHALSVGLLGAAAIGEVPPFPR